MYNPLSIFSILFLFIFIFSCAPGNNLITKNQTNKIVVDQSIEKNTNIKKNESSELEQKESKNNKIFKTKNLNYPLSNNITVLISKRDDPKIVNQFLNIIELAIYKNKIENINFYIHIYDDNLSLQKYLDSNIGSGKIFFGPITTESSRGLNRYCDEGALFFSFASNKSIANDCIFLLNFFPKNEIETIFDHLPKNSKVAFVYPENSYGYKINEIVDVVSQKSNSIIVNRASYNENLENVRSAIKELGKYELRKFELNRQKKLLALKKDENSKQRLKKLERFTTTNDYDFTHVLIADYGIRLLQVAPLLAYYDIDPNIVKFIGTGAWDDPIFFNEPTLQNAIFPGVEYKKRQKLIDEYLNIYEEELMRVSTLPYDLVGLLAYLVNNDYNIKNFYELINNQNFKFDGLDGGFYFQNNLIERELKILQIREGKAHPVN